MKTTILSILRPFAVFTLILVVAASGIAVYAEGMPAASANAAADGTVTYVVAKGDTLYGISRQFGVPVNDILAANNMTKESVLKAGKKLTIPLTRTSESTPPKTNAVTQPEQTVTSGDAGAETKVQQSAERKYDTYTVQKGDTFWRIANINAITVDELKKMNNLTAESTLKAGQKLKIPATIVDTANAELPDLPSSDPRNYGAKQGDSTLVWPVKKPTVTYIKGKVSGVQLTADKNESVTTIRAGTVMYCGNYRGYGQVVFVQSKTGHIYAYSGLGSIKVEKGQYVVFGDILGTVGTDSIKGTSQISLMVFQKGSPIDPAKAPRG